MLEYYKYIYIVPEIFQVVFLKPIEQFLSSLSDVLYPKNSCSPHSGVPAEVLCRGRDFVVSRTVYIPIISHSISSCTGPQ